MVKSHKSQWTISIDKKLGSYVNSLDWSVRIEYWSGTLEWSTGVFKLIS